MHMRGSLLQIRRRVDGREVQEPMLLALGLTATGVLLVLVASAGAVFATASFGWGWGLFAAVATTWAAKVSASWMSSTDLMKCVWPRMKLVSSGFSTFTV